MTTNNAHRQLQQRVRVAWREERVRGTYNPPDELGIDLDSMTDDELVALGNAVCERVAATDAPNNANEGDEREPIVAKPVDIQVFDPYDGLPDLPCGWRWIGRYRAEHATYGRTATYNDARLLLKALRKHQPRTEKRNAPPERVQGELFTER